MKNWLVRLFAALGVVFASLIIIAFIAYKFAGKRPLAKIEENSILYVKLNGPIAEYQSTSFNLHSLFKESFLSLDNLLKALEHAETDPKISGVIFNTLAPELGIAQAQELRNALIKFKKTGKFAYFFTDTFGEFSPDLLGYYFATAFDEIWLQPIGELNITGVYTELPYIRKLLDQWNIVFQVEKREEYKSFLETYTNDHMSQASREELQQALGSIFDQMTQAIAQERKLEVNKIKEIINQGPYSNPEHALKMSLIDHVGYLDQLYEHAKEKTDGKAPLVPLAQYLKHIPEPISAPHKIAIIYGVGEIQRIKSTYSPLSNQGSLTPEDMIEAVHEAIEDTEVEAIIFRINSPGGSPAASETILRQVMRAKEKNIPVIVSMSDLAGSGGYWIAAYADKIVAQPMTITGSIGVISGKLSLEKFWPRFDVNWDSVGIGNNSDMWTMNKTYTEDQLKKLAQSLDYIYANFKERVSKGRNLSPEQVEAIAKGRIWTGYDAKKLGLVDELGGLDKALVLAKIEAKIPLTEKVDVVTYPLEKPLYVQLLEMLQGQENQSYIASFMKPFKDVLAFCYAFIKQLTRSSIEVSMPEPVQHIR